MIYAVFVYTCTALLLRRKMLNAIRSVRVQSQPPAIFASQLPKKMSSRRCGVRFAQAMSGPNPQSTEKKLDQSQEPKNQRGETIDSFGEGYASRSDEEGFGGTYGGKQQSISKEDEEKIVHGNPEYDESQGSEVK